MMTASYSPEDNKLRLYSVARLNAELYARVREAGFIYAPKQELFVAPMWTPQRAALLEELCGEIGDEETSLEERAGMRASRFGGYTESRTRDAEQASKAVDAIASHIPMGQPILVGHHSERRARRDAERIESNMRKAVKMWETAEYWKDRARGVISHANYKDKPGVRMRRIKGLGADLRKYQKEIETAERKLLLWTAPDKELTLKRALGIMGLSYGLYDYAKRVESGEVTPEEARTTCVANLNKIIAHYVKWRNHTDMRIAYETELLNAQGHSMPDFKAIAAAKRARTTSAPIINTPEAFETYNQYRHEVHPASKPDVITKEQWSKCPADYRGVRKHPKGYRYRIMMDRFIERGRENCGHGYSHIYIQDQKRVEVPSAE